MRIQSPFYDASTSSKEGLNEKTIQRCVLIMGRYVEQVHWQSGTGSCERECMQCMVWDIPESTDSAPAFVTASQSVGRARGVWSYFF